MICSIEVPVVVYKTALRVLPQSRDWRSTRWSLVFNAPELFYCVAPYQLEGVLGRTPFQHLHVFRSHRVPLPVKPNFTCLDGSRSEGIAVRECGEEGEDEGKAPGSGGHRPRIHKCPRTIGRIEFEQPVMQEYHTRHAAAAHSHRFPPRLESKCKHGFGLYIGHRVQYSRGNRLS